MKKPLFVLGMIVMLLLLPGSTLAQTTALSSTFTYQGFLTNAGGPINGICDLQFGLFNAVTAGTQIGSTLTKTNVAFNNGSFSTQLDFGGAAFDGTDRYLQIGVRCPAGSGGYSTLAPRQALTPTPYASSLYGMRVLQNATSPNLIGGYNGNNVTPGVVGAFIGGGGLLNFTNRVTDDYGVIGGGEVNQAGNNAGTTTDARWATVAGGQGNNATGAVAVVGGGQSNLASGTGATIAGGYTNTADNSSATVGGGNGNTASGVYATVGGGDSNTASDAHATVGGGSSNTASIFYATVGGGNSNTASGVYATVGGGDSNTASGSAATVGGGVSNIASGGNATVGGGNSNTASGIFATIPGGYDNHATGAYSFAAGYHAYASNDGTFTWADSTGANFGSNINNVFLARASGGFYLYTNPTSTSGVGLAAGSGSWSSLSDQNMKANFAPVDSQAVLQAVADMPLSTWNYISQDAAIRHIGPMAQDFYASFGVGEDDTHISQIDSEGVALAAIQGLYQEVQDKNTQITDLKTDNVDLRQQLDTLKTETSAMESRLEALEAGRAPVETHAFQPWMLMGGLVVGGVWFVQRKRDEGGQL